MKKIIICFIIFLQIQQLHAQSVGIGTTTPNSKAALDISSTTQGVLIPRMTTTERNAILFPPDGLLIFNTTTKMLNQRQDGFWKAMINNYSWEGGGTGQMYNVGDNVGLNIPSPTERLEVGGNIRTTGAVNIDNISAILQLKSGAVNKGFVQLSGDNLRLGTNSGNTTGNVVVRMNGSDKITINPDGDINIPTKITSTSTGSENLTPICYGYFGGDGTIIRATPNVSSIVKTSTGTYEIICASIPQNAVVSLATNAAYTNVTYSIFFGGGKITIKSREIISGMFQDSTISFIVY